jgi:hypothetical protein
MIADYDIDSAVVEQIALPVWWMQRLHV